MTDPVHVCRHPTVGDRLAQLRAEATSRSRFRELIAEVASFLAFEALSDLETRYLTVRTPVGEAECQEIVEAPLLVPILRAGLGMVPGVQLVAPTCDVAHLGLKRDETTLAAICYLDGLPADLSGRRVVVCDPMLATGGSLIEAVRFVERRQAARVQVLSVVASRPGLQRFHAEAPGVEVWCAAVDPSLDERGYIVPGLGDAGDRLFGPPGEGLTSRVRSSRSSG